MRIRTLGFAAAALLAGSLSVQAQIGVGPAPIDKFSVMGNPTAHPAVPIAIPLPECKAGEFVTIKSGAWSCEVPAGGSGGTTFVTGNGLQLMGGVLSLTNLTEDRSAADYPITEVDSAKTILVGARTYTLPQAGTAGILDNWSMCFSNQTDSSTATIKTTVSKFIGAPGAEASEMKLPPKQTACVTAWKGNYNTIMVR